MKDSTSQALLIRSSTKPRPIAIARKTMMPRPMLVRVMLGMLGEIGAPGTVALSSGWSDILSRFLKVVVCWRRSRISM